MRVLKWISIVFGSLIVLLVLGVLTIVWLVDPNRFKPRIEAAVRQATGRDFSLVGDIELGFYPWLALRAGEGSFGNPPDFGPGPMVSWKRAQLGAKLIPLLRGELVADRVVLDGADLRLVRHADGHANWEGMGSDAPRDPDAKPMQIHIDGVEIENTRVSFVDETVPRRVEVTALHLTTDEIAPGVPFTDTEISGVLHANGFAPAGVPFRVAAPEATLPADFSRIELKELEVKFGELEAKGGVSGVLGEKPELEGDIEIREFNPRALAASVGVPAPKTADPKALGRLALDAKWSFARGAIAIDPVALTLDETHLRGSFHREEGEDPVGEFSLQGDSIDLARYIPPTDPKSPPFVLPTAKLRKLRFRGVIEFDRATLDAMVMKGVTLRLLLDDAGLRSVPPTVEKR